MNLDPSESSQALSGHRWLGPTSVGALGLLGLVAFILLNVFGDDLIDPRRVRREKAQGDLAYQVFEIHLRQTPVTVEAGDPEKFIKELEAVAPFAVVLPSLGPEFRVSGASPCELMSHPAVHLRYRGPGGTYSLLQFRMYDFDMPPQFERILVQPKHPALTEVPADVLVWTKGERGYALVGDAGVSLEWMVTPSKRRSGS